ncbi:MAG: ATP-dependent 6-phosphofructokinase [Pseudonocardiaceae bacterium]
MTGEVHEIATLRAARQISQTQINQTQISQTQLSPTTGDPNLSIKTLGAARIDSPLSALLDSRQTTEHYVDESDRVLLDDTLSMVRARGGAVGELPSFEPAGPRRKIFFDPSKTRAGIVTCGGLCPGLNEDLTPANVRDINVDGGTVLGTSRGPQDPEEIVDCLERLGINILFVIGGDGTMRGAMRIAAVIEERGARIAVVGVPKTIDNDIPYLDQSFGFQTAFARASESIHAVTVEAKSTSHGIGLVKLMGRHSGFIACYAALARNDADVVLIPEVPFQLDGEYGLLHYLQRRVRERGYAVVVVAEGAGQELLEHEPATGDASGNAGLRDICALLRQRITGHFAASGIEACLRFIDPSYAIRSVPANPYDSVYCVRLAQAAVHAAMSGRTEMVVGRWRRRFVHLPTALTISKRNQVDPHGDLWMSVLEATGQPATSSTTVL